MRPLSEVRSDRHDNLVEPDLGVAQHDTASDSSLNLDRDSWIPTGLGGKRHASRAYADIFALGNAPLLVLVTIGNAIFDWCVAHFLFRAPRDG